MGNQGAKFKYLRRNATAPTGAGKYKFVGSVRIWQLPANRLVLHSHHQGLTAVRLTR